MAKKTKESEAEEGPTNGAQIFAVYGNPMKLYMEKPVGPDKANTMFYNRAASAWLTHYYLTLPLSCASTSNLMMPMGLVVKLW